MASLNVLVAESRGTMRVPVHCRVKVTVGEGRSIPLIIVNLSEQGLMARTNAEIAVGTVLQIPLPVVGTYRAEVRWAMGGRIGCQLSRPLGLDGYRGLLAAIATVGEPN